MEREESCPPISLNQKRQPDSALAARLDQVGREADAGRADDDFTDAKQGHFNLIRRFFGSLRFACRWSRSAQRRRRMLEALRGDDGKGRAPVIKAEWKNELRSALDQFKPRPGSANHQPLAGLGQHHAEIGDMTEFTSAPAGDYIL